MRQSTIKVSAISRLPVLTRYEEDIKNLKVQRPEVILGFGTAVAWKRSELLSRSKKLERKTLFSIVWIC